MIIWAFLKSTSGTEMTDFLVYLVTLIYRLNCSYRSLSFQGNVLLEKLITTAKNDHITTNENKKYLNK